MNTKKIILIRNAHKFDFGGGERFPVFVADVLQRNDYYPIVISRSPKLLAFARDHKIDTITGWWWSKQNWNGINALLFPFYVIWQIILFLRYFVIFIKHQPHAIHIQSKDDFIAATFAGKLLRKKIIWTDHADLKHIWMNINIWYKNPVGKLVYLAAILANTITLVSNSEKTLISNHLKSSSSIQQKMKVIYNGVVDRAKDYPSQQGADIFTFCVASRLVSDKGIKEVIEAYTTLTQDHPNTKLLIMGDGPEAASFKQQAENIDSIEFTGHQNNPLQFMSNSDAFVHPTYHEGFSVALVEASMLGMPIIATAVGGNVEIIHNEDTGLLVRVQDTESLYLAMKRILEDEELRMRLGTNARKQYEEKFEFNHIVQQDFIPLYEGSNR